MCTCDPSKNYYCGSHLGHYRCHLLCGPVTGVSADKHWHQSDRCKTHRNGEDSTGPPMGYGYTENFPPGRKIFGANPGNECCGEAHVFGNPCQKNQVEWARKEAQDATLKVEAMEAGYALLQALESAREITEAMDDHPSAPWGLFEFLPEDLHVAIGDKMGELIEDTSFTETWRR